MNCSKRLATLVLMFAALVSAESETSNPAEQIRVAEHERSQALVKADVPAASRLIADDFQLINPAGGALSKKEYLGQIATGEIHYLQWEPDHIEVKLYGKVAVIRYQALVNVKVKAIPDAPTGRIWFTDLYEFRNGRWQIVWSQGTLAR